MAKVKNSLPDIIAIQKARGVRVYKNSYCEWCNSQENELRVVRVQDKEFVSCRACYIARKDKYGLH